MYFVSDINCFKALNVYLYANRISEVQYIAQSSIAGTASNLIRYNTSIRDLSSSNRRRLLNQVVFNVLKNPNPLKDVEASALLCVAVLV